MHACGEDLEVLEVLTGATPRRPFDTQLAGAFAGHGFSLGYRGLVDALLDVALEKGETRSNWLRRPLSSAQLRYAALDVAYLLPMHQRLSGELAALGRGDWLEEEFEHQRRGRVSDGQPDAAYLRVRRRGALAPADHAVLRALCLWRETEAMARDIPRRHLVADKVLIALAKVSVLDTASEGDSQSLSPRATARYGQALDACIAAARQRGPTATDTRVDLRPYTGTLKRLREIARRVADTLQLPVEVLANRRALESLLVEVLYRGDGIPPEFRGWRFDVITRALLDCLHESG